MRDHLRPNDQLRSLRLEPDFLPTAEGSVLMQLGSTRVICAASLEESVPAFLRGRGRGWVTAEYAMLPRATLTRTPREVAKGRPSGRTAEIQRLIGRSLRAVVDLEALGERTLTLDCDVVQADGGTRTASICGAFVALGLALRRLVAAGTLPRLPLRNYLAAISVGMVGGEALLDLNYTEDSHAEVDMNLAMTGDDRLVEIQATAESEPLTSQQTQALMQLGRAGIAPILAAQHAILGFDLPRFEA